MKKIILKEGEALVLRTCAADMTSHNGFKWPRKGTVEAPDWKPTKDCGNGLHGFLWGEGDASLASGDAKAKWVVCVVEESKCIDLDGKVKFPEATVVFVGKRENAVALIQAHAPAGKRVNWGTATAGWKGTATAGDEGTATAGDEGTATAGDEGTATAGWKGTATAGDEGTATAGNLGTATAGLGSIIRIFYRCKISAKLKFSFAIVTEDGPVKPGVKYRLNEDGEFVEVGE